MAMLTVLLLLSAAFALGDANSFVEEDLCPSGWTKYGSRCFMFVKTARTWPEAERHCVSLGEKLVSVPSTVEYLGANLVSVHSSEEEQFLQTLVKTGGFPPTWIGGFDADKAKDRLWFWSDGSDFDHQNWAKGRPNNAGARERCIQMNFGGERRWNNAICGRRLLPETLATPSIYKLKATMLFRMCPHP